MSNLEYDDDVEMPDAPPILEYDDDVEMTDAPPVDTSVILQESLGHANTILHLNRYEKDNIKAYLNGRPNDVGIVMDIISSLNRDNSEQLTRDIITIWQLWRGLVRTIQKAMLTSNIRLTNEDVRQIKNYLKKNVSSIDPNLKRVLDTILSNFPSHMDNIGAVAHKAFTQLRRRRRSELIINILFNLNTPLSNLVATNIDQVKRYLTGQSSPTLDPWLKEIIDALVDGYNHNLSRADLEQLARHNSQVYLFKQVAKTSPKVEQICRTKSQVPQSYVDDKTLCTFKFDYDQINQYLVRTLGENYRLVNYLGGGAYGKTTMYCTQGCNRCVALKVQIKPPTTAPNTVIGDQSPARELELLKKMHSLDIAVPVIGELLVLPGEICAAQNNNCCSPSPNCAPTRERSRTCSSPANQSCKQCNPLNWRPAQIYIYAMAVGNKTLSEYLKVPHSYQQLDKVYDEIQRILNVLSHNNITHGDMHTGNIMVFEDGSRIKLKLIDAGMSVDDSSNKFQDFSQLMKTLTKEFQVAEHGDANSYKYLYNRFKQEYATLLRQKIPANLINFLENWENFDGTMYNRWYDFGSSSRPEGVVVKYVQTPYNFSTPGHRP